MRSSFQDLKRITGIPGLVDLYFFLRDNKPLNEFLEFKWDSQILYRLLPEPLIETIATDTSSEGSTTKADQLSVHTPTTQEEIPVPSGSVVTPTRSNLSNPADLAILAKDDKEEEPQTTETSTELFPEIVKTIQASDLMENINYYHIHEDSLITDTEFVVFHCLVYEAIEKWITSEDAKKHPFTITWSKWKCLGLNHHQPLRSLRRILGIEDLTGYIREISSCPDIHKYIGWTWEAKDLRYWVVPREYLDDTHTAETSQVTLHNMTTELTLFKTKFDVSLKDFNNRLANYHFRLEQNDLQIKKMAKSLQVSLQQVIESSKVSIHGTMEAQKDIFQRKLTHIMDNNINDFKSMLHGACNPYETEIQRREQKFYGNLEGIADKVIEKTHKELYTTAEDALATLNNQIGEVTTQLMDNINHTTSTVEPPVATTVPDVPQSGSNASRWNLDPQYREHLKNLQPSQPPMFNPAGTGQNPALPNQTPSVIGGMPANMMYTSNDGLPWLQFDKLIKRAKIQYSGQDDIIVFYNQLHNIANNYGVFIRKLQTMKTDMSVCPK